MHVSSLYWLDVEFQTTQEETRPPSRIAFTPASSKGRLTIIGSATRSRRRAPDRRDGRLWSVLSFRVSVRIALAFANTLDLLVGVSKGNANTCSAKSTSEGGSVGAFAAPAASPSAEGSSTCAPPVSIATGVPGDWSLRIAWTFTRGLLAFAARSPGDDPDSIARARPSPSLATARNSGQRESRVEALVSASALSATLESAAAPSLAARAFRA